MPAPRLRAALVALAAASLVPAASAQDPRAASPPGTDWAEAPSDHWPHKVSSPGGTAMVYQPQVIAWPGRQQLDTRIALGIQPNGAPTPALGTIEVAFATSTDLASRTVTLTQPKLVSTRFPTLDTTRAVRVQERIQAALGAMGPKRVPLDMVLASLHGDGETPPPVPLKNDPPKVFVSSRPASLLVFDGKPVLAPIRGTPLSFAVNTNWDVLFDADTKTWYWLDDGAWLAAKDVTGKWAPAGPLPAAFSGLPDDASFASVKKQIPGRTITTAEMPTPFVSTVPAEIIVTSGPPAFVAIPGTSLEYVSNTDAALFRAGGRTFYYLVSGRWFSAPRLEGPWTFATRRLPPDFARIPPDGPRGFVLASVPGTAQAQEALIQAQIPQQVTVSHEAAKLDVIYSGPPKFQPIPGTSMAYAVNTSFDVLRVGPAYYSCYQGAWFVSPSPTGAWTLATTVPAEVYTIPPGSPLYPCTYLRVVEATPTGVTYVYTSGYTMSYVSSGVVVYGTGFYYPPYFYPAPVPIYYPYPYSYSGAVYYNSATGAWARGGAIYGPYGGVVEGGTAYNPETGAWAHGGAIYGPNGGAGAFSAYNPTTGGYAHGDAVWGPDGASANASWYNPRTGISGSTDQNWNDGVRTGSSTFSGPNQTVHTQSQTGPNGSAGKFSSSTGAEGAGVHGADGNNAGVVKGAGGNVYAGADGNVYKKTDDGWEKYNDGSWSPVQPPSRNTETSPSGGQRTSDLSGATEHGQGSQGSSLGGEGGASRRGGGGSDQLERDDQARTQGWQSQQRLGASGAGFGGGRFGGGGFGGGGGRFGGGGFRR